MMNPRVVSAAKPLTLGIIAAAIAAAAGRPELATLAPVLAWIADYANSIAGNLQSTEIERQETIGRETAHFLRNEQIATHVGRVAGAVLEDFAQVAQPEVRAQFHA